MIKELLMDIFICTRGGGSAMVFGLLNAVGQVAAASMQAANAQAAANARAQAEEYNAQVARNNAQAAVNAAEANMKQQRRKNESQEGNMLAQMLANGYQMEGTPLLLFQDNAAQNELERQKIRYKGNIDAMNFTNQATLNDYNAEAARAAGNNEANAIQTTGALNAFGSVGRSLL